MPNLTVKDKSREYTHQIDGDRCTIGRGTTNTIPVEDAKASKEHCEVVRRGDRWKLVDLESKNGTKVNGTYKNTAWLEHDDEIAIGAARIRFGVGGARRSETVQAAAAGAGAGHGSARAEAEYAYDDDYDEGSRYRSDDGAEKFLKYGGFTLGVVLILLIVGYYARRASDDPYNVALLEHAEKLIAQGDYPGAIDYLESKVDDSGAGYHNVLRRIEELRDRAPVVAQQEREDEAEILVNRLAMKEKYYHQGKTRTTSPEEILEICEELKTKYADTDAARGAKRHWPGWFAGKVPERAVDYIAGDAKLRRDWDDTVRRADEYRREDRFLQAIETITRFVSVREALMNPGDLARYESFRDQKVRVYERLAESAYYKRDRIARGLVKSRRYDEGVKQFKQVIDRFGMDKYVRKAQAEIAKIKALKKKRQAGG